MRKLPNRDESAATLSMAAASLRNAGDRAMSIVQSALKFYGSLKEPSIQGDLERLYRTMLVLELIPSCTNNMSTCATALDGAERKSKNPVPLSQTVISSEVQ